MFAASSFPLSKNSGWNAFCKYPWRTSSTTVGSKSTLKISQKIKKSAKRIRRKQTWHFLEHICVAMSGGETLQRHIFVGAVAGVAAYKIQTKKNNVQKLWLKISKMENNRPVLSKLIHIKQK